MKKLKKIKVIIKGEIEVPLGNDVADFAEVEDILDCIRSVGTLTDVSYEGE